VLDPGWWRSTTATADVESCVDKTTGGHQDGLRRRRLSAIAHAETACVGGATANSSTSGGRVGDDYCAPEHTGPLCRVCTRSGDFFSSSNAKCQICPSLGGFLGGTFVFVIGVAALAVAARTLGPRLLKKDPRFETAGKMLRWVFVRGSSFPMLKQLIAYFQACCAPPF
jgi:hypothetical protein